MLRISLPLALAGLMLASPHADAHPKAEATEPAPVWRADAKKIRAFVLKLEEQLQQGARFGDGTPGLSTKAALRAGRKLGDKPSAEYVEAWRDNEQRRFWIDPQAKQRSTVSATLPTQLALATLRTQSRAESRAFFRSVRGAAKNDRMKLLLQRLREAVKEDGADGAGHVPPYLAKLYDSYARRGPGVDLTSTGFRNEWDSTDAYDRVRLDGDDKHPVLRFQRNPNEPADVRVLSENSDGMLQLARSVRAPGAEEAQHHPIEELNTATLHELQQLLTHAHFRAAYQNKHPFAERAKQEIATLLAARRLSDRQQHEASRAEVAQVVRRSVDASIKPPAPIATAIDLKLEGTHALTHEIEAAKAALASKSGERAGRHAAERIVGAAGDHPTPEVVRSLIAGLRGLSTIGSGFYPEEQFLVGSVVPHAVLGVTHAQLAPAFAQRVSKVPAPGTPVRLADLEKIFAEADFHEVDAKLMLHALHVAHVARHNEDVVLKNGTNTVEPNTGRKQHFMVGTNDLGTLATADERANALDFGYNFLRKGQYFGTGVKASALASVLTDVAGLDRVLPESAARELVVPAPPAGVWAELLNPATEAGHSLYERSGKQQPGRPVSRRDVALMPRYARPLSRIYADHAVEEPWWRSTNSGIALVATGETQGAIARQGEDVYTVHDGSLFVNDRELMVQYPGHNNEYDRKRVALDHTRPVVVGSHIAFLPEFSKAEIEQLRNIWGWDGSYRYEHRELMRRLERGTPVFDTAKREWVHHRDVQGRYDPADAKLYHLLNDEAKRLSDEIHRH